MKKLIEPPVPPKRIKKIRAEVHARNGHKAEEYVEVHEPALSDMEEIYQEIEDLLKMSTYTPERKYWLDVNPELNAVLGSRNRGLPYGKISELSGLEHGGKTTLTTYLAGLAQQDGAAIGYIDVENSRDGEWAERMGLDLNRTLCLYPRLTKAKKEKLAHVQAAEDMFAQAEVAMDLFRQRKFKKQFWMLDSIAMLSTRRSLDAGALDQNMRTRVDRAHFLSETLPRWAAMAQNYNAMIILINQIRLKIGVVFGDPQYTPGGKALDHTCSIRARVKRLKQGYMRQDGRIVGLIGTIRNTKNKAGGGSVASEECGFKIYWKPNPAKITFMTKQEAEEELKG